MGIFAIIALLIVGFFAFSAVWGIVEFVIAVLIWALIGFLAGQLTRGHGFGLIAMCWLVWQVAWWVASYSGYWVWVV